MPRAPRNDVPGAVLHVASRGVAQQAIYLDDLDRRRFLALLGEVVVAEKWRCLTYCLMGNHYHLLIQVQEPGLSGGMQRLNGEHARTFNQRHERSGHLFQGRFWSKPVRQDAHLLALARYIALNPVQAQLCRTAGEWPWSAHRELLGDEPAGFVDSVALLSHFNPDLERARIRYAEFVAGGATADGAVAGPRLGSVLSRGDRDRAIAHAHLTLGHRIPEIAAAVGCHPETVRRCLAAMSHKGV